MKSRPAMPTRLTLMLAAMCWAAWAGAQTTATQAAPSSATPSAAATPRELVFGKGAPKRAVLAGERVNWFTDDRKSDTKKTLESAAEILGMEIDDQTAPDEKAAETAARLGDLLKSKPSAVIIFSGAADEKARSKDEQFAAPLQEAAQKAVAAGARVYIIPSSPKLSATMIANLRVAATGAGAEFVETGTEIGGTPYFDSLTEVRKVRDAAAALATTRALAPPAETPVATLESQIPRVPQVQETPHVGESPGVDSLPPLADGVSSRTIVAGPGATPAIVRMVPPPALKSVDPRSQVLSPKRKKGADKKPSFEP